MLNNGSSKTNWANKGFIFLTWPSNREQTNVINAHRLGRKMLTKVALPRAWHVSMSSQSLSNNVKPAIKSVIRSRKSKSTWKTKKVPRSHQLDIGKFILEQNYFSKVEVKNFFSEVDFVNQLFKRFAANLRQRWLETKWRLRKLNLLLVTFNKIVFVVPMTIISYH